jgi:hypothetical protein
MESKILLLAFSTKNLSLQEAEISTLCLSLAGIITSEIIEDREARSAHYGNSHEAHSSEQNPDDPGSFLIRNRNEFRNLSDTC